MGLNSKIEWTHHTFNPWWGCTKVSPACDNCYAERDASHYLPEENLWGVGAPRKIFNNRHWKEPVKWNKRAEKNGVRYRVFTASMADVFDNEAPVEERARLFELIKATPNLDWLILTKRVGNIAKMLPNDWGTGYPNVWLGISVVNQQEADRDIPKLLTIPAAIRWLSVEPMLAYVSLKDHRVDWVVCGGESGTDARPLHPLWPTLLKAECGEKQIPFLFKQWGEWACTQDYIAQADITKQVDDGYGFSTSMSMVGKQAAGRLFYGITYDGYPIIEKIN